MAEQFEATINKQDQMITVDGACAESATEREILYCITGQLTEHYFPSSHVHSSIIKGAVVVLQVTTSTTTTS